MLHGAYDPYVQAMLKECAGLRVSLQRAGLLTRQRERELIGAAQNGDLKARDDLVNQNILFINSKIKRFMNRGVQHSDLLQEGILGYMDAIRCFKPELGWRLNTYAAFWIRQSAQKALRHAGAVSERQDRHSDAYSYCAAVELLMHRMGREPHQHEVLKELGWDVERARRALRLTTGFASRNDSPEAGAPEPEDPDGDCVRELMGCEEDREQLQQLLDLLPDRVQLIIKWRAGVGLPKAMTLSAVGASLGITKERVRQIETRAMEYLRKVCNSPGGSAPIPKWASRVCGREAGLSEGPTRICRGSEGTPLPTSF